MCYMSEDGPYLPRVGVRELRQNLSVYLERVKAGETLEVTEHGHPVAELRPRSPETRSAIDRLVAEGRVHPASHDHRLIPPPLQATPGPALTEVLLRERAEDDR